MNDEIKLSKPLDRRLIIDINTPVITEDNIKDIMLIDKCIQVYQEWQDIAPSPKSYQEKVANDFKTIDLSVIDNIIPRIS